MRLNSRAILVVSLAGVLLAAGCTGNRNNAKNKKGIKKTLGALSESMESEDINSLMNNFAIEKGSDEYESIKNAFGEYFEQVKVKKFQFKLKNSTIEGEKANITYKVHFKSRINVAGKEKTISNSNIETASMEKIEGEWKISPKKWFE